MSYQAQDVPNGTSSGGISHERMERIDVVTLSGSIEMDVASGLDQALRRIIEEGSRRLLIDLTRASYIVSMGFRAILNAQVRMTLVDGMLQVVCPLEGAVRRLLHQTRLDDVLLLAETREEGMAALRSRAG